MAILCVKLLLAPVLICLVTLAGRRWGSIVSGFLIGLPLISGPISLILAWEYGLDFASRSAIGNLAGQISNCVFGLTYIAVARHFSWPASSCAAIGGFFAATVLLNQIDWQLWPALGVLLATILIAARLAPHYARTGQEPVIPKWDLPGRILTATGLVVLLTSVADTLGPQLSGLISPFPAFSVIFAAFTQAQQGAKSAANLLRGVIVGSGGYATFFVTIGALLPDGGILLTYLVATGASIFVGGLVFLAARRSA